MTEKKAKKSHRSQAAQPPDHGRHENDSVLLSGVEVLRDEAHTAALTQGIGKGALIPPGPSYDYSYPLSGNTIRHGTCLALASKNPNGVLEGPEATDTQQNVKGQNIGEERQGKGSRYNVDSLRDLRNVRLTSRAKYSSQPGSVPWSLREQPLMASLSNAHTVYSNLGSRGEITKPEPMSQASRGAVIR